MFPLALPGVVALRAWQVAPAVKAAHNVDRLSEHCCSCGKPDAGAQPNIRSGALHLGPKFVPF